MNKQHLKFGQAFHENVLEHGLTLDQAYEYARQDVLNTNEWHRKVSRPIEKEMEQRKLAQQQFEKLNNL